MCGHGPVHVARSYSAPPRPSTWGKRSPPGSDISHSLAGLWWRFRFSCLLGVIGAAALLNGPQGHCSVRAWWWQWKHLFKTKWAHHSHINLLEMKMILQAILWKARKVSSLGRQHGLPIYFFKRSHVKSFASKHM